MLDYILSLIYLLDQNTTGMPCIQIIHRTDTLQWTVWLLSIRLTTMENSSTIGKSSTFSPVDVSEIIGGQKPFRGLVAKDHCSLKCLHVSTALVGLGIIHKDPHDTHLDTPHSVVFSGRVIGPSQRPLPDNTQHSQQTDIYTPTGFEPAIPASERPQNYALDHVTTGIDRSFKRLSLLLYCVYVILYMSLFGECKSHSCARHGGWM
jgi:hypothetical protein